MTQQPITVKDAMNLKVMHLNLHRRFSNWLHNMSIKTLSELTKFNEHSLMSLNTIGKKSIAEIESNLHLLGLKFKMTEQDWEIWTLEHEALIKKLMLDERIDMLNKLKDIVLFIENNSNEIIGLNKFLDTRAGFIKSWLEPVLAQIKIPIVKDEKLWKELYQFQDSLFLEAPEVILQIKKSFLIDFYGGKNYVGKMKKLMEFRSQNIDIYINKEIEESK